MSVHSKGEQMERKFKFELGAKVQLMPSWERGIVVGRAEYSNSDNSYFVRYSNSTGLQEKWWPEDALELATADVVEPPPAPAI